MAGAASEAAAEAAAAFLCDLCALWTFFAFGADASAEAIGAEAIGAEAAGAEAGVEAAGAAAKALTANKEVSKAAMILDILNSYQVKKTVIQMNRRDITRALTRQLTSFAK
ncbi:3-oxoacyl-ACP reductase-like protein [Oxalobacteraceae bacterium GrIS 1.11]